MPRALSSAAGPTPLSLRSCGVLKVPAEMITSLLASAVPIILLMVVEWAFWEDIPSAPVEEVVARGSAR